MNKNKPNNDNLVKYHIRLNAEEYERLKERLKKHLHDNKLYIYQNLAENLNCQREQTAKHRPSLSAIQQEVKDQIAKWMSIDEDQKKRVYAHYVSTENDLDILRDAIRSFNVEPQNSLKNYYKKINYASSINEALAKDWNNVYEDFHTGFTLALKEQLANEPNNKESDERKFG